MLSDSVSLRSSERKEGKKEKGQAGRRKGRKEGRRIAVNIYRMTICQVVCTFLFNPSTTQ